MGLEKSSRTKNRKAKVKLGLPVEGWNRLPENMALAGIIQRYRHQLGLSQNQFADKSGFTRQMLGWVETDKYLPGLEVLGRIARKVGVRSSQLLAEAEEWISALPKQCHDCKYACMAHGELIWLSSSRQCTRPVKTSPKPETTLPALE